MRKLRSPETKQLPQSFTLSLSNHDAAMKLRQFLLGRKAMTNLDRVLKSRDITLLTKVHIVKVMFISVVMYGCESWIIKKLSAKELMLLNCGAWMRQMNCESLGQQGDPTSPFRESTLNIHRKDWCWSWSSSTSATWWEELTHWKIPWCWERLKAKGEVGHRGWDS